MAHSRVPGAAVRAGDHVSVGAQGGWSLEGAFAGPGDPAAQAEQAVANIRALLAELSLEMAHVRRLRLFVTDRAWLGPVREVLGRHWGVGGPARVEAVVAGLRTPEMLVAIEAEAVAPA